MKEHRRRPRRRGQIIRYCRARFYIEDESEVSELKIEVEQADFFRPVECERASAKLDASVLLPTPPFVEKKYRFSILLIPAFHACFCFHAAGRNRPALRGTLENFRYVISVERSNEKIAGAGPHCGPDAFRAIVLGNENNAGTDGGEL